MTRAQTSTNKVFVTPDFALYYRKANTLHWRNHTTSHYGVIFAAEGRLSCSVSDRVIEVNTSQALIIEPNNRVEASAKAIQFVFLTLAPSLVMEHAASMRITPRNANVAFVTQPLLTDNKLVSLFSNFTSELLEEKPGKEIVMRALAEQTVVHLLRRYSAIRRADELELSRVGLVDRRIRRSVELMHAQLDQDLSLRTLAAVSYLSPFHFSRLFKKITGATPHNYLASIRANHAQLLLVETEMSITEVGARVGYLSASHFTKAFRMATGMSPREFRKAVIRR